MEKETKKGFINKQFATILLFLLAMAFPIFPEVQAKETLNIHRHDGYSRENVAENVAQQHFSDSSKAILVNREKFPDAISATNISQGRYPVLYTNEGRVTSGTLQQLQSMPLEEIYILGGELSIRPSVETQLKNATGVDVTRVAGRSRYDANVSAVRRHFTQANHVVIASGEMYADALYGVSYANTIDAPVVLTNTNRLEASSVDLLGDLNVQSATIIGGPITVTTQVESQLDQLGITYNRIAGRNRYIGSAEVAVASYQNPTDLVIASGEVFSDALVSAPLAQKLDAPILLVRANRMESVVGNYIRDHSTTIENIYIQGGHLTITPSLLDEVFVEEPAEPADKLDIPFDMSLFNQEILALVNQERLYYGIEALYYEPELQHGLDIRTLDSISVETLLEGHKRPDGSEWYTAFNYLEGTPVFAAGENIAFNGLSYAEYEDLRQTTGALEAAMAELFFNQYKNSPGHYANMMGAGHDGMGVSAMFANHDNNSYRMRVYNTMVFSYRYHQ